MRALLFLIANVLFTSYLFTKFYDPTQQYLSLSAETQCIAQNNNQQIICADCYKKSALQDQSKGFLVTSTQANYLILKAKMNQTVLSCKDYLQMVNDNSVYSLKLQENGVIREVIKEIGGQEISSNAAQTVISSQYPILTIFRSIAKTTLVQISNPDHLLVICKFYLYILNGVAIIIVAIFAFKIASVSKISYKVIVPLVLELISLELACFNVGNAWWWICLARVLLISAAAYRLQLKDSVAIITICLGIPMQIHELTWILYLMIVLSVLTLKGAGDKDLREVWIYLFVSLMLLLQLSSLSFFLFRNISNSACLFVEISLLILTPLGLVAIKDQKAPSYKMYTGGDPEKRSISLSGFEQEQEEDY